MGSDIAVAEQPVSSTDRSNTSAHHRHRLHHLLAPRSIAVLGVSARRRNIGAIVMDNIRAAGFRGPVTGVGRERATVAGRAGRPVAG